MSNKTDNMSKTPTVWMSYVGKGAPSNASGARVGLGWTKAEASARAEHWNNQAPYERFRRVTLSDGDYRTAKLVGSEWSVVTLMPDSPSTRTASAHFEAGRYASAWLTMNPPSAGKEEAQ